MSTKPPALGDFEIRLLRIFVAVVENGGLAKAQTELNLSLSSISSYISKLEDRFGVRLCHRGRSGFSLTEKGQIIYEASKSLFKIHDDFRSQIGDLQSELIGELRLGVIENLVFDPTLGLPDRINEFLDRNDRVWLSLSSMSPADLEAGLLDGNIHVGIGQYFRKLPSLSYETLYSDKQVLFCGRKHPLFDFAPEKITRAVLEQAHFADRGYASANRLPNKGVHFHPTATCYNVEAILILILSGRFISYLPEHYAHPWVQSGDLLPILPDELSLEIEISLAVQRDVRPTSLVRTFINELINAHRLAGC